MGSRIEICVAVDGCLFSGRDCLRLMGVRLGARRRWSQAVLLAGPRLPAGATLHRIG